MTDQQTEWTMKAAKEIYADWNAHIHDDSKIHLATRGIACIIAKHAAIMAENIRKEEREVCAQIAENREMVNGQVEQEDRDHYFSKEPHEWSHDGNGPAQCGRCGAWLTAVRPGKHQCDWCGDGSAPGLEIAHSIRNRT